MDVAEDAPRGSFELRVRHHGLAEIVERSAGGLRAAHNYAESLSNLKRYEEAKVLLRKVMPVARRILGEGHKLTLMMRWYYAAALFDDPCATLDDLREAVVTLEDTQQIARRVLGGAHPDVVSIEGNLQRARAVLRAHETPSP